VAIRLIEIAIKQKGNRTTKMKTKTKITKNNLHTQALLHAIHSRLNWPDPQQAARVQA